MARGHAGTAGPRSSRLAHHARRRLLHRDDPEPGQQCLPAGAAPEPLQRQHVRVTQGRRTSKRDLLLFRDTLVIAKAK